MQLNSMLISILILIVIINSSRWNPHQTQSAHHLAAINTSTQNLKQLTGQKTTVSQALAWTVISLDLLTTWRLLKSSQNTTGRVLIRQNIPIQPRRWCTTMPQILMVTSLIPRQILQPPRVYLNIPTNSHERHQKINKIINWLSQILISKDCEHF